MTREHWKELLPIIQAFADGEEIQIRVGEEWLKLTNAPLFNDKPSEYRIKPKPREIWVCIEDGTAWDHEWQAKNNCAPFQSTPMRFRQILD